MAHKQEHTHTSKHAHACTTHTHMHAPARAHTHPNVRAHKSKITKHTTLDAHARTCCCAFVSLRRAAVLSRLNGKVRWSTAPANGSAESAVGDPEDAKLVVCCTAGVVVVFVYVVDKLHQWLCRTRGWRFRKCSTRRRRARRIWTICGRISKIITSRASPTSIRLTFRRQCSAAEPCGRAKVPHRRETYALLRTGFNRFLGMPFTASSLVCQIISLAP